MGIMSRPAVRVRSSAEKRGTRLSMPAWSTHCPKLREATKLYGWPQPSSLGVSRWLQGRLESVRVRQSGGEEDKRACSGGDYGDAADRRRRGGAHLPRPGGARRQETGGLQGCVDADRSGDWRGAVDFPVAVGGGYARQRGERLPPSGAWGTGRLLHQRAGTQALRG